MAFHERKLMLPNANLRGTSNSLESSASHKEKPWGERKRKLTHTKCGINATNVVFILQNSGYCGRLNDYLRG